MWLTPDQVSTYVITTWINVRVIRLWYSLYVKKHRPCIFIQVSSLHRLPSAIVLRWDRTLRCQISSRRHNMGVSRSFDLFVVQWAVQLFMHTHWWRIMTSNEVRVIEYVSYRLPGRTSPSNPYRSRTSCAAPYKCVFIHINWIDGICLVNLQKRNKWPCVM